MKTEIKGEELLRCTSPMALAALEGQKATIEGCVHNLRELGGIAFVILRTGRYLLQTVYDHSVCGKSLTELEDGCYVSVTGTVRREARAAGGVELLMDDFTVLSRPAAPYPLNMADRTLKATLATNLDYRTVALRHPRERAVFRIMEGIETGFREFMQANDFAEIHSPKITAISAEGGAEVFRLKYFGADATLAQSPQQYKQMCVAFFGRVFEVGPVYRAELHNTSRHLNEYTGLDFEMGYIHSMYDVMNMETAMLRYVMRVLAERYRPEIDLLKIQLPEIGAIPSIKFAEAVDYLKTVGGGKNRNDLTADDEVLLCRHVQQQTGSEFVFVTHFPSGKRPFYVMDDPENPKEAYSFDLLFRGLEITTGGQRIHDYNEQIAKLNARGMDPAGFESYLSAHKYGLPPHGGLGIGLERLTMKLCNLANIREASLFPRDLNHLDP